MPLDEQCIVVIHGHDHQACCSIRPAARGTVRPDRAIATAHRPSPSPTRGWLWQPAAHDRLVVTTSRPPPAAPRLYCRECVVRDVIQWCSARWKQIVYRATNLRLALFDYDILRT